MSKLLDCDVFVPSDNDHEFVAGDDVRHAVERRRRDVVNPIQPSTTNAGALKKTYIFFLIENKNKQV